MGDKVKTSSLGDEVKGSVVEVELSPILKEAGHEKVYLSGV
jgi:hypothetical protein